jgi:hypothetical protein
MRGIARLIVYGDVLFADCRYAAWDSRMAARHLVRRRVRQGPGRHDSKGRQRDPAGRGHLRRETNGEQSWKDQGFRLSSPDVLERRVIFETGRRSCRRRGGVRPQSFSASTPMARSVTSCRLSDPATAAMPSLGLSAALRTARIDLRSVRVDGTRVEGWAIG